MFCEFVIFLLFFNICLLHKFLVFFFQFEFKLNYIKMTNVALETLLTFILFQVTIFYGFSFSYSLV